MPTFLIDALCSWSSKQKQWLASKGIVVEFVEGGPESAYVDLVSALTIGRASLWENGLCDMEALSVATGEQLLCQHHEGIKREDLDSLLEKFVNWMLELHEER